MPKIYVPFTEHTSEKIWAKFSLVKAGQLARDGQELSLHLRLFLVGLGRVSNKGHAPFKRGELQRIMGRIDGSVFTIKHIQNEISRLIQAGLLAPVSNIRCLLYPMELIVLTTDKKNVATCDEHGTHSSWSAFNNDWAPDYPPQGVVEEVIIPAVEEYSGISFNSVGEISIGCLLYTSPSPRD